MASALPALNMSDVQKQGDWVRLPLFKLVTQLIMCPTMDVLFGPGAGTHDAKAVQKDFWVMEKFVPVIFLGLPTSIVRLIAGPFHRATTKIGQHVLRYKASIAPNHFEKAMWPLFEEVLTPLEIAKRHTALLFAGSANSIPSAFWMVAHIVSDPIALARIQAEIDGLFAGSTECSPELVASALEALMPAGDFEADKRLRLLDSCMMETLRVYTSFCPLRVCQRDTTVATASGRTFAFRRGDQVIFPLPHHDPALFDRPEEFLIDRFFLEDGGTAAVLGKRLHAFGFGRHLCPGRFLIQAELRALVVLLLRCYDCVLDGPLPGPDFAHVNVSVSHPAKDVGIKVRPRVLPATTRR